jgi:hypothetical protein
VTRRFGRRSFLRGLGGVVVGLPFLESLPLGRSWAGAEPAPRRFVGFIQPNGVNVDVFWPSTDFGPLTEESFDGRSIAPLVDFRDRLTIARGIHTVPRGYGHDGVPGDEHGKGLGHRLTAAPVLDFVDQYSSGVSVDQVMALHVNPVGRPPLTLFVGDNQGRGIKHVSYRGAGDPVTAENNPWLVYQDMMGLSGADAEARERILARRQSVLDLVSAEMEGLRRLSLSQADRDKLDMHFTAIRDLEQSLGPLTLPFEVVAELSAIDPATVGTDERFPVMGRLQIEVLALAIATDYTRVATVQWGAGAAGPVFRWDGMEHEYDHHKISHGNTHDDSSGDPIDGARQMQADIDRWYAGRFRDLLERLDQYTEEDGTVLDASAVVWMNEMSDGASHDYRDVPVILGGSCGGFFRMGEHVKLTRHPELLNDADAPHNKLLTTLLDAVGARDDSGEPFTEFGQYGEPGEFTELRV